MNMTTSQRIALRFALTIAGIVFFLGLVINIAFLGSWRQREQQYFKFSNLIQSQELDQIEKFQRQFAKKTKNQIGPRNMLFVSLNGSEHQELRKHTFIKNLAHFGNEWYMYNPLPQADQVLVVDVTPVVNNQISLIWITLISVLFSSALGYLIAVALVRTGLRDLHTLAKKVKTIDVENLQLMLASPHLPENDEIQIVSRALEGMTAKVHNQVSSIKQFVANVSHEFKTPLMSLQSTIDLTEKTKKYDNLFHDVRDQVGIMYRLLDTLTMMTRSRLGAQGERETISLDTLLIPLLQNAQQTYKDVVFSSNIAPETIITTHQGMAERILSNLLDNAGKFTPKGGIITVSADAIGCTIQDTGIGIDVAQQSQIREPFWQGDDSRITSGFGLGLSLVKQLSDILGRKITLMSEINTGTTVSIKR